MADIDINQSGASSESVDISDSGMVSLDHLILKPVDRPTVSDRFLIAVGLAGVGNIDLIPLYSIGSIYSSAEADIDSGSLSAIGTLLTGSVGIGSLVLSPIDTEAGNTTQIGGASLLYPSLEQTSSGLTGAIGALDRDLYGYMDVSGTLFHPGDVTADITLPLISVSGSLLFGNSITADLSFFPQVSASGYTGAIGSSSNLLGALSLSAGSFGNYVGQASIVLPIFTMDEQQPVSITIGPFSVYCLNTENMGVTSFSNFSFDSFANFNGSYLASSSSGLFLLQGNDDYGTHIDLEISKLEMFGDTKNRKRIKNVYADLETDGRYEIGIKASNETFTYSNTPTYDEDDGTQTIRMKVGKGLSGRYFAFSLKNKGGSNVKLSELSFDIDVLERSGKL